MPTFRIKYAVEAVIRGNTDIEAADEQEARKKFDTHYAVKFLELDLDALEKNGNGQVDAYFSEFEVEEVPVEEIYRVLIIDYKAGNSLHSVLAASEEDALNKLAHVPWLEAIVNPTKEEIEKHAPTTVQGRGPDRTTDDAE